MTRGKPWILGLSASHNGSACLLHGDEIVVAIQEERLTRAKRARTYAGVPSLSVTYCLEAARIKPSDLAAVCVSAQGHLSDRENDVFLHPDLRVVHNGIEVVRVSHHVAHAISAVATSGTIEAAVLVVDGHGSPVEDLSAEERGVIRTAGNWEMISMFSMRPTGLEPVEKHCCEYGEFIVDGGEPRMPRFRSLGGIFAAASAQIFGEPSEAGKVMGFAPYGEPVFPPEMFYHWDEGTRALSFLDDVPSRFSGSARWPDHREEYERLAASCQAALEDALLEACRALHRRAPFDTLCYAGGVALNSVANERIVREGPFKRVFIMPAAEDSGPAIGAAYHALWTMEGRPTSRRMSADSFGRQYSDADVDEAVRRSPAIEVRRPSSMEDEVVDLLCDGKIVAWFEGGSELGPRALGQRSILCDPRAPDAKERLNARVKHREMFRPFAPAILASELADWFDASSTDESPFMLRVMPFIERKRREVPAVVHVDGTGRVQTLSPENGGLYRLVKAFHARTGVPMLLNTSFNVAGEPIVESPEDALWALVYTHLDACVIEGRIMTKRAGLTSILDLYPFISSHGISVRFASSSASDGLETSGRVTFESSTRYGPVSTTLSADVVPMLSLIDGQRSGWAILEELRSSDVTEVQLVRWLGRMRRQYILGFDERPVRTSDARIASSRWALEQAISGGVDRRRAR